MDENKRDGVIRGTEVRVDQSLPTKDGPAKYDVLASILAKLYLLRNFQEPRSVFLPAKADDNLRQAVAIPNSSEDIKISGDNLNDDDFRLNAEFTLPFDSGTFESVILVLNEMVGRSFLGIADDRTLEVVQTDLAMIEGSDYLSNNLSYNNGRVRFNLDGTVYEKDISSELSEAGMSDIIESAAGPVAYSDFIRAIAGRVRAFNPYDIGHSDKDGIERVSEEVGRQLGFQGALWKILDARSDLMRRSRLEASGIYGLVSGLVREVPREENGDIKLPGTRMDRLTAKEVERLGEILKEYENGNTYALLFFAEDQDPVLRERYSKVTYSNYPGFIMSVKDMLRRFDRNNHDLTNAIDYRSAGNPSDYLHDLPMISGHFTSRHSMGYEQYDGFLVNRDKDALGQFNRAWKSAMAKEFNPKNPTLFLVINEPYRMLVTFTTANQQAGTLAIKINMTNATTEGTNEDPLSKMNT